MHSGFKSFLITLGFTTLIEEMPIGVPRTIIIDNEGNRDDMKLEVFRVNIISYSGLRLNLERLHFYV